eukprot:PhF_6_TR1455/c0_g1_i1/m.2618
MATKPTTTTTTTPTPASSTKPSAPAPTTSPTPSPPPVKIAHTSERLLSQPRRKDVPPLPTSPKLSKDREVVMADRLSTQAALQKKKKVEEAEIAATAQFKEFHKVFSPAECDAMVQRMYYNQRNHDLESGTKLKQKYVSPLITSKQLTKDDLVASATRLCTESQRSKSEMKGKLVEKYITGVEPKFRKMNKEEMAASALRLTAKK